MWCDKIIFVNSFDQERALKLGIGSENQTVTIYNGVPQSHLTGGQEVSQGELLSELQIEKDSFLCVFVGRLAKQKGLNCLMEAIAIAKKEMSNPKVHLVVIGEGELEGEMRQQIRRLDIADRVHLLRFLTDYLRWTGGCDLFVLSSLWERCSISLLEAMGLGRPIVATGIKSNRETITCHKDGLLIPPGDPVSLAHAIIELATDSDRATQLGQAAKKTFNERFTGKK